MTPPRDTRAMERLGVKPVASLVGREEEVGIIKRCIDEAVKGHGGTILLEGEAGIGKSRLITEMRGHAEQNGARSGAQIRVFEDTWRWDRSAAAAYEEVVEKGGLVSQAMQAFRQFLGESDVMARHQNKIISTFYE